MTNQPTCSCNKSRDYDELKQRYRKLEQIAKDIYAALHINEHCSIEFIADCGDCDNFRDQLKELGVEL